jgi:hypothetical protein
MIDPDGKDVQYFLGLDLGQASDPSALTVTEQVTPYELATHSDAGQALGTKMPGDSGYAVRHIRRFDLGTPYTEVVRSVAEVYRRPETGEDPTLVMDATGIGAPVVDQFHEEGLMPVQIKFTGGDSVASDGQEYRVPKADLATTVQSLLQTRRLAVAEGLDLADQLAQEMKQFRVKISDSGHARFEHATESETDDILLSMACALWFAEQAPTASMEIV